MNTESIYRLLVARCEPHIKSYRDDLIKHDREAMEKFPGVPYIHWTRVSGTQILMLRPADHETWPKDDSELKKFLFGKCGRRHMIKELSGIAGYFSKDREDVRIVHHFDGYLLQEITKEKAVKIADRWRREVESQWNTQGKSTALCYA